MSALARLSKPAELDDATREALYALLSSLADNKLVLGRRYAEWCVAAPMIESAVALAAMAQDELGHARSLYPLLNAFPGHTGAASGEESGWQARPTSALRCLERPFEGWADVVAANLVADTAFAICVEAATDSRYEPLGQRARKMVQEEAAHWSHAHGWLRRLSRDEPTRRALQATLSAYAGEALAWFGPDDDQVVGRLQGAGILAAWPGDLRARLLSRVEGALAESWPGRVPCLDAAVDWGRWDPAERRWKA